MPKKFDSQESKRAYYALKQQERRDRIRTNNLAEIDDMELPPTRVRDQLKSMVKNYDQYVHYMGKNLAAEPSVVKLLSCECQRSDGTHRHQHGLLRVTKERLRELRNCNGSRGKKHDGTRPRRVRFDCPNHLLNVVHYLRCPKGEGADHEHYGFDAGPLSELELCNGKNCSRYREKLRRLADYKHEREGLCMAQGCITMRLRSLRGIDKAFMNKRYGV